MSDFLKNLKKGHNLSFEDSKTLFNELMEGKYDDNSIIEILESLIKKGHVVIIIDNLSTGRFENIKHIKNRITFFINASLCKYFIKFE